MPKSFTTRPREASPGQSTPNDQSIVQTKLVPEGVDLPVGRGAQHKPRHSWSWASSAKPASFQHPKRVESCESRTFWDLLGQSPLPLRRGKGEGVICSCFTLTPALSLKGEGACDPSRGASRRDARRRRGGMMKAYYGVASGGTGTI